MMTIILHLLGHLLTLSSGAAIGIWLIRGRIPADTADVSPGAWSEGFEEGWECRKEFDDAASGTESRIGRELLFRMGRGEWDQSVRN
jgi:hypothetical protein